MNNPCYYVSGLHRSGTNYLESLLYLNLKIKAINSNKVSVTHNNWKHRVEPFFSDIKDNSYLFLIYKPVHQWIESVLIRNESMFPQIFNNSHGPMYFEKEPNKLSIEEKIIFLAILYKKYLTNWILNVWENKKEYCYFIYYPHLLIDNVRYDIIDDIADKFGFQKIKKSHNPEWGKVFQSDENYRKDLDFAAKNLYYYYNNKLEFNSKYINLIDSIISKEFINNVKNHIHTYNITTI